MEKIVIEINISTKKLLRYYQGEASAVVTQSVDGRMVRFPANILRPYVTHQGVQGLFELKFNETGKLLDIRKLSDES